MSYKLESTIPLKEVVVRWSLVSSARYQEIGQEEKASSGTRQGLDWTL